MSWIVGAKTGFDVEGTGLDVATDRIVSATAAHLGDGAPRVRSTLIDPGVEIPADSTKVHGITTERVRAEGKAPAGELEWIAAALVESWEAGIPVVGMNLAYDLSILDAELRRHGLPSLVNRLGGAPVGPVIDIMVIDKWADQWRSGKRRLENLCQQYGVAHDGAHDAEHDTIAACRVAWRMGRLAIGSREAVMAPYMHRGRRNAGQVADNWAALGRMSAVELHQAQAGWYPAQAKDFAAGLRKAATKIEEQAGWSADETARDAAYAKAQQLRERANVAATSTGWPLRTAGASC